MAELQGRYVAVVGPDHGATTDDVVTARDIADALAGAGAIILTGGLGGVMAAAAEGARRAGGTSVALLPGPDRTAASAAHTLALPTGLGEMRNALLVRSADVVVAVGGSWGTLSEIALAVRTGVPVVAVGGWALPEPGPVLVPDADAAVAQVRRFLDGLD